MYYIQAKQFVGSPRVGYAERIFAKSIVTIKNMVDKQPKNATKVHHSSVSTPVPSMMNGKQLNGMMRYFEMNICYVIPNEHTYIYINNIYILICEYIFIEHIHVNNIPTINEDEGDNKTVNTHEGHASPSLSTLPHVTNNMDEIHLNDHNSVQKHTHRHHRKLSVSMQSFRHNVKNVIDIVCNEAMHNLDDEYKEHSTQISHHSRYGSHYSHHDVSRLSHRDHSIHTHDHHSIHDHHGNRDQSATHNGNMTEYMFHQRPHIHTPLKVKKSKHHHSKTQYTLPSSPSHRDGHHHTNTMFTHNAHLQQYYMNPYLIPYHYGYQQHYGIHNQSSNHSNHSNHHITPQPSPLPHHAPHHSNHHNNHHSSHHSIHHHGHHHSHHPSQPHSLPLYQHSAPHPSNPNPYGMHVVILTDIKSYSHS